MAGTSLLMQPHDLDLSLMMRGGAGDTEGAVSIVVLVTGTQEGWCRGLGNKTPYRTGARGSIHSPYFSVEPKPQCRETAVPRTLPALGAPGPGPQPNPSGGHRGCTGLLWEERRGGPASNSLVGSNDSHGAQGKGPER